MQIIGPGVLLSTHDVHMLSKVLRLATRTADSLEADKNQEDHPEAVEVRLINAQSELVAECGIDATSLRNAANLPPLIDED